MYVFDRILVGVRGFVARTAYFFPGARGKRGSETGRNRFFLFALFLCFALFLSAKRLFLILRPSDHNFLTIR